MSTPEHQAFCGTTYPQERSLKGPSNHGMAAPVLADHSDAVNFGEVELGSGPGSVCWRVMASHTAPEFKHLNLQDNIRLGVLLGAGNFGRVYRGRWLGLDVAVKVLQHDANSAEAMAFDMGLIVKVRHPNIAKTLHFGTWEYSNPGEGGSTLAPPSMSQGCPQAGGDAVCNSARETASCNTASCSSSVGAELQVAAWLSAAEPDKHHRQEQQQQQQGDAQGHDQHHHHHHHHHQQQQQQLSKGASSSSANQDSQRRAAECQTWLIYELCNGGTLLDILESQLLISKTTGKVDLAHVLTLLCEIASGMAYLHGRNVLHGNLKPGNVLMKKQPGAAYGHQAMVTDFAASRSLTADKTRRSTHTMGSVNYASPEVLRLGRHSPASDVYAFAIIMWELYTGSVAWSQMHYGEILERVAFLQERPSIPTSMPTDYATLMVSCWSPDPFKRPNFESILHRLQLMLSGIVQQEQDAQDRFFSDL